MGQISEAAAEDRGEQIRMSSSSITNPQGSLEAPGSSWDSPELFADHNDLPQFS